MKKGNRFLKECKILVGSIRFDWKRLFIPSTIGKNGPEDVIKEKKIHNAFFIALFVIILVLGLTIVSIRNVNLLGSFLILFVFIYVGFCSIMNNLEFKKNNSGRTPIEGITSFKGYFKDTGIFTQVDNYIRDNYSENKKMNSPSCHCLITVLIQESYLTTDKESPIADAFISYYKGILSFSESRAVTKAKIYSDEENNLKELLCKESSKNSSKE